MLKFLSTFLLFFCLTTFSYGQEVHAPKFSHGFSVGLKLVSPIEQLPTIASKPHFSPAFYGNVYYKLTPLLEIGLGIGLQNINLNKYDFSLLLPCDLETGRTDIFNSYYDTKYQNFYISAPLDISIDLSEKQNHFYIKTGGEFSYQVLTQTFNTLHECGIAKDNFSLPPTAPVFESNAPNNYFVTIKTGVGYLFHSSNGRRFFVETFAEYALNDTYDEESLSSFEVNSRLWGLGLRTGFRF